MRRPGRRACRGRRARPTPGSRRRPATPRCCVSRRSRSRNRARPRAGPAPHRSSRVGPDPRAPADHRGQHRKGRAQQLGASRPDVVVAGQQVHRQRRVRAGPRRQMYPAGLDPRVVPADPLLGVAEHLDVGRVQVDRRVGRHEPAPQLRRQHAQPAGAHRRQSGLDPAQLPAPNQRASRPVVVAAGTGACLSKALAGSARTRSSPAGQSWPHSCPVAIPTSSCPPVSPRARALIGPTARSSSPPAPTRRPLLHRRHARQPGQRRIRRPDPHPRPPTPVTLLGGPLTPSSSAHPAGAFP